MCFIILIKVKFQFIVGHFMRIFVAGVHQLSSGGCQHQKNIQSRNWHRQDWAKFKTTWPGKSMSVKEWLAAGSLWHCAKYSIYRTVLLGLNLLDGALWSHGNGRGWKGALATIKDFSATKVHHNISKYVFYNKYVYYIQLTDFLQVKFENVDNTMY